MLVCFENLTLLLSFDHEYMGDILSIYASNFLLACPDNDLMGKSKHLLFFEHFFCSSSSSATAEPEIRHFQGGPSTHQP